MKFDVNINRNIFIWLHKYEGLGMVTRNKLGQEAIEFVLITTLVFFSALAVVLIFGNKLAGFFNGESSASKLANSKVNVISAQGGSKYNTNIEALPDVKIKIGDEVVSKGFDGSITFQVNGKSFKINKNLQKDLNAAVYDGSGAVDLVGGYGGTQELMAAVKYMINKYDPDASEPVEIFTGTQARTHTGTQGANDSFFGSIWGSIFGGNDDEQLTQSYSGIAATNNINSIAIKLGDAVLIINQDQNCSTDAKDFFGKYKMEGLIGADDSFNSAVTGSKAQSGANYSTTISKTDSGGLLFNSGNFDFKVPEVKKENKDDSWIGFLTNLFSQSTDTIPGTGTWSVDFTNSAQHYTF